MFESLKSINIWHDAEYADDKRMFQASVKIILVNFSICCLKHATFCFALYSKHGLLIQLFACWFLITSLFSWWKKPCFFYDICEIFQLLSHSIWWIRPLSSFSHSYGTLFPSIPRRAITQKEASILGKRWSRGKANPQWASNLHMWSHLLPQHM